MEDHDYEPQEIPLTTELVIRGTTAALALA
jgi:hypothetical protein